MSTPPPEHESKVLDAIIAEAKTDLRPEISDARWDAMEEALLARVSEEEERAPRAPLVSSVRALRSDASGAGGSRMLKVGALILAAAAAVAVVVKKDPGEGMLDRPATTQVDTAAGSLRATEGPGEVRVGGVAASAGHVLRTGDLLEADGARAVLERPRRVMWLLEGQEGEPAAGVVGRARVKSAGESLVLGLEDGAIEAQVTPVPSGEAFAVDVATEPSATRPPRIVRVAVHGTHLRVTRAGTRVTVDLTEGVVSIGVPPKVGMTYGTLVTAPAHVELDVTDLQGTLRVDHTPSAVRAAIPLVSREAVAAAARPELSPAPPRDVKAAPPEREREPVAARPAPVPRPSPTDPEPPVAKIDPTKPAPPPRDVIAAAVRDCAAARSRPGDVRVTVTSSLRLKINAGGDVETAQFDPPLLPEIQTCAAAAIYKAKLTETGATVTIPIEFSY